MIQTFPKRYGQTTIASGEDEVIAVFPIPANAILKNVWIDFGIVMSGRITTIQCGLYSLYGYIIPLKDPDTASLSATLWDTMVPKDTAVGASVMDMDTTDVDPDPVVELGDINVAQILGMSSAPTRVFRRQKLVHFPKSPTAYNITATDFQPVDGFTTVIKRDYRVEVPSLLMFGVGAPDTLATNMNHFEPQTTGEWAQLSWFDMTLEQMAMQAVGLTEAATDAPYEEAAALVGNYLEWAHEKTPHSFAPAGWTAFTNMSAEIMLPGKPRRFGISGQS